MIKIITSKSNPKIKYACNLKENKFREEHQEFIAESKKTLELALKANLVKEIFTYDPLDLPEEITQYIVNEEVMKKLSSSKNPEGVVFIAKYPNFKKDNLHKIIYLENINDPGNLGTIIRTALAFNFDAVVTSPGSVSIYNEKVLAACKGSNFLIPTFNATIDEIKDKHQIIASTLVDNSISINEVNRTTNFILIMGNEAHGISSELISKADVLVKIPMNNIDSLNVAVAAGIFMYELTK